MTREELIKEAEKFEDTNKHIPWKPHDFPEDIEEDSTLDEVVSDGNSMYYNLIKAIGLIHDLKIELEFLA